ncbi:MAG: hypothetical protein AABX33_02780 [Nanoarchaeota archaeon]
MNKSAKKKNFVSIILTVLVIGLYLIPNFASAVSVQISDIPNTNKGNDIEFDVSIDIQDPDKFVPLSNTNLTIEYTGAGNHIDKLECEIQVNGDFQCFRTKGNHKTEFTDIEITAVKDSSLGFGYGYGYGYGYGFNPGFGYGYSHDFGYGYGYGTPSPQFGKITYHVLWHTPVNLHPGQYTAVAKTVANNVIFSSGAETFEILTPADPINSISNDAQLFNGVPQEINAPSVKTKLNILTNADVNGTIEIDEYNSNPTSNANFGVLALGRFIVIEADSSIDDSLTQAVINISYNQGEVNSAGIAESTLRLYFYNGTSNTWTAYNPPNGGVNTNQNYVWAVTTHFSIWGLFGASAPAPSAGGTGGGGGGGGGGSGGGSFFSWQCSEWSECSPEGSQTRTCNLVPGSGGSNRKPEETKTCTIATPAATTPTPTKPAPTTTTPAPVIPSVARPSTPTAPATPAPRGLGALTGRVISTIAKPGIIAAVITSILALAGLYAGYFYLYKKK